MRHYNYILCRSIALFSIRVIPNWVYLRCSRLPKNTNILSCLKYTKNTNILRWHASGGDAIFTNSNGNELEQFCKENVPHLALNMVGGRETVQLLKCLGNRSTVVTYGAMSNSPLSVPFGLQVKVCLLF